MPTVTYSLPDPRSGLGWPAASTQSGRSGERLGWPGVSPETDHDGAVSAAAASSPQGASDSDQRVSVRAAAPSAQPEEFPAREVGAARETSSIVADIARAPGPRRARFDLDEFDRAGAEQDVSQVSRETRPSGANGRLPVPEQTRVLVVANQKGGV